MQLIRLGILCCLLLVIGRADATTSLSFGGGGYSISMEIGHDVAPVIASLNVSTPRARDIFLYGNFKTTIFDVKRRILEVEFQQKETGAEPGSFTLSVEGDEATLRIDNQVIKAPFSWEM